MRGMRRLVPLAVLAAALVVVSPAGSKGAANINFSPNQTVGNLVNVPVSAQGEVCFFALADTDIVVDVNGWFATS